MFLGGLTARAIRLKKELTTLGHEIIEVYPGGLARHLSFPKDKYKKQKPHIPAILNLITKNCPLKFVPDQVLSWHHVDALLAAWTGWRYSHATALSYGTIEEGKIWV